MRVLPGVGLGDVMTSAAAAVGGAEALGARAAAAEAGAAKAPSES